ncbi:hypothetical protein P7C71_g1359, partial [Lecanoromycetidae sp. Uapishka_2]
MSAFDIISTLNIIINLGFDIKARFESFHKAAEEINLLNTKLRVLCTLFEDRGNDDIFTAHLREVGMIVDIVQSIAQSYTNCAKALGVEIPATNTAITKPEAHGKKYVKRVWLFYKIPDLLDEIQRKAEQLEKVYSTVSIIFVVNIRTQQRKSSETEIIEAAPDANNPTIHEHLLGVGLSTNFASIDLMVGNLMKECSLLRQRLQEVTLCPDTSVVEDFQEQHPEGVSFWRDRFQKDELCASALRYETLNIDLVREQGSRYRIDQNAMRCLSTIRPLWLPALRSALDPLHKGYVKPRNFFNVLHDSSLSDTLRRITLESAGYGIFVECERASADLPLPAAIESSSDHVGWISAQVVAVPTSDELGIVNERDSIGSSSESLFTYFKDTSHDVHIYVRYLETGQIERKSLSKQIRPIGGISIGAPLSIRHELESGGHAWSCDLQITEFKACYGGQYIITTGVGSSAIEFSTRPLKNSFDKILRDDDNFSFSTALEFDYNLLGPSKVFTDPPKIGEKIQIEYEGFWYDARVMAVDGDEIEYTDWDGPTDTTQALDDSQGNESDSGSLCFPEEQLMKLGKGSRRLWRPWRRDVQRYDVRPYRCFHIGDSIEAPVMYPDFRFHYHTIDNSQLYLPARIVDVQSDKYVIRFSPALSAHGWWPGRMPKGQPIDLVPGLGISVENPFDFDRVTVDMDWIRPFSAGPRPVLGVQSIKPSGWNLFQGVQLGNLEDLLERSLWRNVQDSKRTGGQRDQSPFIDEA